ncbi:unnamed protein product [Rhizophagus irregularis]|nr:unnamed protein product [Rhizophagus irregularis]
MNTQNTAELTTLENSSLEASIHAPASGSVISLSGHVSNHFFFKIGVLTLVPGEILTSYAIMAINQATWKDGPINTTRRVHPWNIIKSEWNRDSNKEVAIKKFRNATYVSEFLDEIKNNLSLNFAAYCNVIYGVTRDPQDNKYAIVMKFQNLEVLRGGEFTKAADVYGFGMKLKKNLARNGKTDGKQRLSKLTINPYPLKRSQNFLTSKQLEYSKQLTTQLIDIKPYYTRQFDMSLCLSTRI